MGASRLRSRGAHLVRQVDPFGSELRTKASVDDQRESLSEGSWIVVFAKLVEEPGDRPWSPVRYASSAATRIDSCSHRLRCRGGSSSARDCNRRERTRAATSSSRCSASQIPPRPNAATARRCGSTSLTAAFHAATCAARERVRSPRTRASWASLSSSSSRIGSSVPFSGTTLSRNRGMPDNSNSPTAVHPRRTRRRKRQSPISGQKSPTSAPQSPSCSAEFRSRRPKTTKKSARARQLNLAGADER